MRVTIGPDDAHHRVSSGQSQTFQADSEVDVPRETAEALIASGQAKKTAAKRDGSSTKTKE